MAQKPRKPAAAKASRAGKDAHSPNAKVRRESMEVLALVPRKPKKK